MQVIKIEVFMVFEEGVDIENIKDVTGQVEVN